jgi:putative transposase
MRPRHYTLTSRQVHRHAQDHLQRYLHLTDHGPKCTASALYAILFWAASRLTSLAAACASLARAPCEQAAYDALRATLPQQAALAAQLNRALRGGLPRPLRRRKQKVAVDLTLLPYYGLPQADPRELYKGQKKAGTRTFHAYATAYVIFKGCRWTLTLRQVHHSDPWEAIVRDLLRQVQRAGVKVECVLLDRGFYCVDVVRYLQRARYPFVMPAIRRGLKPEEPGGPTGTWAFTTWKNSGWADYVLSQHNYRATARFRLAVCRVRRRPDRKGRRKTQVWLYATWGLRASASLQWVRQTYRRRFGIESSYRQLNEARIRTSTRDPLLRLFYVGLALVLRNVYVWLHWEVLAARRRGYRRVDLTQLPLKAMLRWLAALAEEWFGLRQSIPSERPMLE